MLLKMFGWSAAAALAMASPVLAEETVCSVCRDPTFPATENLAPAIPMEQHVSTEVIEETLAHHAATDENVTGHEETVHVHQLASLEDIEEMMEEP